MAVIKENEFLTMNEASKKLDETILKHAEKLRKNLREKRKDSMNTKILHHV